MIRVSSRGKGGVQGLTPTLLIALICAAGPAAADWARFYAAPTRPGPAPAPTGCAPVIPPLSGVPALGDSFAVSPNRSGRCEMSVPEEDFSTLSPEMPDQGITLPVASTLQGPCVSEILTAQQRYAIPDNLLLGIGLQEAGIERDGGLTVWPWSVNAEGEGRFLRDKPEAIDWVRTRQQAGDELIDVGCMQINLRWHPDAFPSLEAAFDPGLNVDYAARYLSGLADRFGSWTTAAGRYHSADQDRAARYLSGVQTNLQVIADRAPLVPDSGIPQGTGEGVSALLDALVSDDPDRTRRPLWSAGLGAGATGDPIYGPYGRVGLRPALPNFQQNF
jgi:hypothetical protein